MKKKSAWSYAIELCAVVLLFLSYQSHHTPFSNDKAIMADGKGYYAYLPAVFIYHDHAFNFNTGIEKKYSEGNYADYRNPVNNGYVDKYFSGVAILWLPFFLAAHILAKLLHLPTDGYSFIYQMSVAFAAIFYLSVALKILFRYLYILSGSGFIAFVTIFFLLFGTNLYHYAVREPSMSHVYSFSLISIFLYALHKVFIDKESRWIIISALLLGLITAVRPSNIMVIGLVPLAAGSWQSVKQGFHFIFSQHTRYLIIGILLAVIPPFIQCVLWYWQCGHFIVYSYGKEGFNWGNPFIYHVLFSFHKGWFIWTPMALIGVVGLFFWIKKDAFRAISAIAFLLIVTYVVSCWWMWYYADSFGAREFVDFLVLPGLGLLYLFQASRKRLSKSILLITCFLLTALNQVQAYQYKHFILLWDGTDWIDYKRVFLKTDVVYRGMLWKHSDMAADSMITNPKRCSIQTGFEDSNDISATGDSSAKADLAGALNIEKTISHSGKQSILVDQWHQFSPILSMPADENDSLVQATLWFYGKMPSKTKFTISVTRAHKELINQYQLLLAYYFHTDNWTKAVMHVHLPKNMERGDRINMLVYDNNSGDRLLIDDMKMDIINKSIKP